MDNSSLPAAKQLQLSITQRLHSIEESSKLESYAQKREFFDQLARKNTEALTTLLTLISDSSYTLPLHIKRVRNQFMSTPQKIARQHIAREQAFIKWHQDVLEKRKFTELSKIKLKQIYNMIHNEHYFIGIEDPHEAIAFRDFEFHFENYTHYFEHGLYFAHSTSFSRFKQLLKAGALLSWESFERQMTKPTVLVGNTKLKANTVKNICFDVNNVYHGLYGKVHLLFPLRVFARNNLDVYSTSMEGRAADVYPHNSLYKRKIYATIYQLRNTLGVMIEGLYKEQFARELEEWTHPDWHWNNRKPKLIMEYASIINEKSTRKAMYAIARFLFQQEFPLAELVSAKGLFFDYFYKIPVSSIVLLHLQKHKKTITMQDIFDTYYELWKQAVLYCCKYDEPSLVIPIEDCIAFIQKGRGHKESAPSFRNIARKYGINIQLISIPFDHKELDSELSRLCSTQGINLQPYPNRKFKIDTTTGEFVALK